MSCGPFPFHIIKKIQMRFSLFYFILLALVAWVAPVPAQDTFTPLITDNTTLLVHIDLQNANVDIFKQNWTKYSESVMKSLRFDEASIKITHAALARDIEKLDAIARPAVEMITQKFGIRELAVIFYYTTYEDTDEDVDFEDAEVRVLFAVPWKGKTHDDLQMLLSTLPEKDVDADDDWDFFLPLSVDISGIKERLVTAGDFLFLVYEKEGFEEWFANVKPQKESAILQGMKSLADEKGKNMDIKIAFSPTDILRKSWLKAIENNTGNEDFTESWIKIYTLVAEKFDWGAIAFNNPLTNPLMKEEAPPLKFTAKMRTATDARQFRELLGPAIDNYIAGWQNEAMAESPNIPEAFFAFLRGYLRTMLPAVEEDKLVFQPPETGWFFENIVNFYGFMMGPGWFTGRML